jgi:hypothetical protein
MRLEWPVPKTIPYRHAKIFFPAVDLIDPERHYLEQLTILPRHDYSILSTKDLVNYIDPTPCIVQRSCPQNSISQR